MSCMSLIMYNWFEYSIFQRGSQPEEKLSQIHDKHKKQIKNKTLEPELYLHVSPPPNINIFNLTGGGHLSLHDFNSTSSVQSHILSIKN